MDGTEEQDGAPPTPYEPPKGFKLQDEMQALLQEAALPNKELWLLRIPINELSLKDLGDKQWKLRMNSASGRIGHFEDSKGNRYDVNRHDIKGSKKFAYVPEAPDKLAVRPVPVEVSIVKNLRADEAAVAAAQPQEAVPAADAANDPDPDADANEGREIPAASQEQAKSGITKESSKHSSKKRKHQRVLSSDGGGMSQAETGQKSGVSSVEKKSKASK